jgi:hypothetical protein
MTRAVLTALALWLSLAMGGCCSHVMVAVRDAQTHQPAGGVPVELGNWHRSPVSLPTDDRGLASFYILNTMDPLCLNLGPAGNQVYVSSYNIPGDANGAWRRPASPSPYEVSVYLQDHQPQAERIDLSAAPTVPSPDHAH